ncbi:hypothetical protein BGZ46_008957 [Entomortierella lignicola]|nr:hypothetical protein BGZ46_008957 [Entomortierella lignicola]
MVFNIFSSPTSKVPLEKVLEHVYTQLKLTRKEKDPEKSLKHSRKADLLLEDAEKTFAILKDSIANAYREHSKLLDELGYHDKAQKSRTKAETWGYISDNSFYPVASRPKVDASLTQLVLTSTPSSKAIEITQDVVPTKVEHQEIAQDVIPTKVEHQETTQDVIPTKVEHQEILPSQVVVKTPHKAFEQNVNLPVAKFSLPKIGERITNTPQLSYCLSLLHPSLVSEEDVEKTEYDWLLVMNSEPDEKLRLLTIPTDLIRAFIREEIKSPKIVAEIVSLAAVLEQDDFRSLLRVFIDGINRSVLLQVHLLDGLSQLIRNAVQGYLDADDLVKILELLNTRLTKTHKQSTHIHRLALTLCSVLDSMMDSQVKGLARESLHEPLSAYLEALQKSSDPYLVYQAAYASQALIYIPDDEPALKTALRRTGKVVRGISGMVSAVKAMDLSGFIDGLQNIQDGLASAVKMVKLAEDTYENVKKFTESGQGLMEALKGCFKHKTTWYPALRGLDRLILEGRFSEFEKLAREAPCRLDPAFQWGLCQRLGEIAANEVWDDSTRQCAIAFLEEIYEDDATWGSRANIKQWILRILSQFGDSFKGVISTQAQVVFRRLRTNGSAEKQALYQEFEQNHPTSYPIMISLPLHESSLLDCVQNKPDVETPLTQLKRERLQGHGRELYISPRAKANIRAKDQFDLTSKVQEFLDSDRKVFLILGDSGAGKSTFNKALEISQWKKFGKTYKRIPLFIHLPAIEDPHHDLITKQLRKFNFTENQIIELKMHWEFILICDGYDEAQQTRNLYISNSLNQPGGWRAQMVISCRTEYIGSNYRDYMQPVGRNNSANSNLFQEAIISPFNKDQIQEYVEQYVLSMDTPWQQNDYLRAFREVPNLQNLVENPFLLKLSLEVLPKMLLSISEFSRARVTRVGLYDEFITQWIERGRLRQLEIELSSSDKEAFRMLSASGFVECGIAYLKELVTAVYENQGSNPVITYSSYRDQQTWKGEIFTDKDGFNLLRDSIPLVRNGDQYRFMHKSILEYGVALAVFDPSELVKLAEPKPVASRRMSTGSIMSFEVPCEEEVIAIEESLLDSPLGKLSLVNDPSVLQFLSERAQQVPVFKDKLLAAIERSKTDKTVRIAAANSITILVRAGFQFNGADLRDIKVPEADLSHGVFDSALLDGADLRKSSMRNVWLRQARLNGAQMKKVDFGELPILKEEEYINCCAYSPDRKTLAVATWDGVISLYETSSWSRVQLLKAHSEPITRLAYSLDGSRVASGSLDETVKLWDVETGDCIHAFQGHEDGISSIAFSPRGNQLASSADSDKTVRVWDVNTGDCIYTLEGHTKGVNCIVYSLDGGQIASTSLDKTVRVWSADTGACIRTLEGHTKSVIAVLYSPKGDLIASASYDKTVRVWNVDTGDCVKTLKGHSEKIIGFAFSPKGDRIATGSNDATVRLWDVETGDCIYIFKGHSAFINCITYSPNGDQIASGSNDKMVRLWDVETGECIQTLEGHTNYIAFITYSPQGNQIAFGGNNKELRLRDIEFNDSLRVSGGHNFEVTCVVHSPNGKFVASGSNDETVRIWDIDTGDCVQTLKGHKGGVGSIAFSAKGDQLVCGELSDLVRLWDIETGGCIHILSGHKDTVSNVMFTPKGDQIVSRSRDQTVRLWDVDTGKCVRVMDYWFFIFSPNGRQIACGTPKGSILVKDFDTDDCLKTLEGHSNSSLAGVFSPKGNQLAIGAFGGLVQLLNIDNGECSHRLEGHTERIDYLVYSPNGDQIASSSGDKTVRLWDTITGDCTYTLQGHKEYITGIVYSPDGDWIASCSEDNSVRLWSVATGQCLTIISDFWKTVTSISFSGEYLVTGSEDKSVRCWQFVKDQDRHRAVLRWSSSNDVLVAFNAYLKDVSDLSQLNNNLLIQRGALFE